MPAFEVSNFSPLEFQCEVKCEREWFGLLLGDFLFMAFVLSSWHTDDLIAKKWLGFWA
jgi:hypothetical protein